MTADNGTIELSTAAGAIYSFDPRQGLDLTRIKLNGTAFAPLHDAPDSPDAVIRQALRGFMFTCGPEHIRQPEAGYPLHGSFVRTPACNVSVARNGAETVVSGHIKLDLPMGGQATVIREWTVLDHSTQVTLRDRVQNTGMAPFAPMLMYHVNIGGRFLGPDTVLRLGDDALEIRHLEGQSHNCVSMAGQQAMITGMAGPARSLTLRAEGFAGRFFQWWHLITDTDSILSLEPASHDRKTRAALDDEDQLPSLAPGAATETCVVFSLDR